jgi:hypothetical protein
VEFEKKAVFDATKPFVVPILSGGEKRCEVRYPSDLEWCDWARAQRTVRRFRGRGKSQSEDLDLPKARASVFRPRECCYVQPEELDAYQACGAGWKAVDVSHGTNCPRSLLDEALETPNGILVRPSRPARQRTRLRDA